MLPEWHGLRRLRLCYRSAFSLFCCAANSGTGQTHNTTHVGFVLGPGCATFLFSAFVC